MSVKTRAAVNCGSETAASCHSLRDRNGFQGFEILPNLKNKQTQPIFHVHNLFVQCIVTYDHNL